MSEPFLGEIRMFGFGFAPRGWSTCSGQLLPIGQNQALFSLLGVTYGGDGRTTFGLPDLRGRTPVHFGSGIAQGQHAGSETTTLQVSQMPAHNHTVNGNAGGATVANPSNAVWAQPMGLAVFSNTGGASMAGAAMGNSGGQPHNNMQPFLTVNFGIALQGIFPSRN